MRKIVLMIMLAFVMAVPALAAEKIPDEVTDFLAALRTDDIHAQQGAFERLRNNEQALVFMKKRLPKLWHLYKVYDLTAELEKVADKGTPPKLDKERRKLNEEFKRVVAKPLTIQEQALLMSQQPKRPIQDVAIGRPNQDIVRSHNNQDIAIGYPNQDRPDNREIIERRLERLFDQNR